MKARIICGLFLFTAISGCIANNVLADADLAENSVNRLSRVALRMHEREVLEIMHVPYDRETFRVGEDRYDVWFYVTNVTVLGQSRMVPKNLTPLTFRNKQLVGVGYDYYHWVQKRETRRPKIEKREEIEDINLEFELQNNLGKPKMAQPTKTPQQSPSTQPAQPNKPTQPNKPVQTPPTPSKPPAQPNKPTQPNKPAETPPNSPPSNLKLGPPPPSNQPNPQNPQKQVSMSKAPKKADPPPVPPPSEQTDDKPEWDSKDEEINADTMDQDFDFW